MIGDCWEVDRWTEEPKKIKIIKETEKMAVIETVGWRGEKRENKVMKRGHNIFSTWEEAKQYLVNSAMKSLDYAKQEVDRRRSALELAKALKPKKE
jgi:hypothetical protein